MFFNIHITTDNSLLSAYILLQFLTNFNPIFPYSCITCYSALLGPKKGADFVKANVPNTYLNLRKGKGTFRFHKLSREIIGRSGVRPFRVV